MAKRDYFQELQGIASQFLGPVNTNPLTAEDEITKAKRKQLQEMTALANNMYPEDATSRFDFWKSKMNVNDLPQGVRKDYWKTYESMHPDGIDGATRDFVDVTKRELGMIPGMSQKEFFLRERVTQTPDWARKELEPLLAEVSTTVANANYNKAQQVYVSDLNTRVNTFLAKQQLDPDVAIDDHVNDMLKLEQMNMMDMASVVNGRVGILKNGQQFVPAFGLNSSDQIMRDTAVNPSVGEQVVVQELARLPIKTAVADNVTSSRSTIAMQEKTSSAIARNWLEEGRYDMNNWDKAFSLMPDMTMEQRVVTGLRGEISSGRIKTEKQLAQAVYQSINTYKHELKTPPTDFGNRKDGSQKGEGWLGVQYNNKGQAVTEYSIGVNLDGEELEIPTLVPGLTKDEIQTVISASETGAELPETIVNKAIEFARKQLDNQEPLFKNGLFTESQLDDLAFTYKAWTRTIPNHPRGIEILNKIPKSQKGRFNYLVGRYTVTGKMDETLDKVKQGYSKIIKKLFPEKAKIKLTSVYEDIYGKELGAELLDLAMARQAMVFGGEDTVIPTYREKDIEKNVTFPSGLIKSKTLPDGAAGQYRTQTGEIIVSADYRNSPNILNKILLHEFQHAEQNLKNLWDTYQSPLVTASYRSPIQVVATDYDDEQTDLSRLAISYTLSPVEFPAHVSEVKAEYFETTGKTVTAKSSEKEILEFYEWAATNPNLSPLQTKAFNLLLKMLKDTEEKYNKQGLNKDRLKTFMFETVRQVATLPTDLDTFRA